MGGLSALVCAAGVLRSAPFDEITPEAWAESLDVNLTGSFLCCRAAFAAMRLSGEGRIVNFGSLSGVYATEKFPGLAAYNVSKYGVIGLTEAIAAEGKEHGISAICVSPGAVDTEMLRQANPALRPGLTPGDVAELVVALMDTRSWRPAGPTSPSSQTNRPPASRQSASDQRSTPSSASWPASGRALIPTRRAASRHLRVGVQLGVASTVDADGRPQQTLLQVEADQLPLLEASPDHEVYPIPWRDRRIELVVVLVGPEGVDVVVGVGRAEQRPSPPLVPSSRRCCSARLEPVRTADGGGSPRRRPRTGQGRWRGGPRRRAGRCPDQPKT